MGASAGDAFADTHGEGVLEPDFLWRRPIFILLLRDSLAGETPKLTDVNYNDVYRKMTQYMAGDFSFMTRKSDQEALEDMFQAVVATRAWETLREDPGDGGFMFGAPELARQISAALKDPHIHSGASYAWCMRQMQAIAQVGWDTYVKNVRAAQPPNEELVE